MGWSFGETRSFPIHRDTPRKHSEHITSQPQDLPWPTQEFHKPNSALTGWQRAPSGQKMALSVQAGKRAFSIWQMSHSDIRPSQENEVSYWAKRVVVDQKRVLSWPQHRAWPCIQMASSSKYRLEGLLGEHNAFLSQMGSFHGCIMNSSVVVPPNPNKKTRPVWWGLFRPTIGLPRAAWGNEQNGL